MLWRAAMSIQALLLILTVGAIIGPFFYQRGFDAGVKQAREWDDTHKPCRRSPMSKRERLPIEEPEKG